MEKINVAVGKIGKKFYMKKSAWAIDSGDSEVTMSLIVLAKKHPEIDFYIVGTNDLGTFTPEERNAFFPNENVFNIWDDFGKQDNHVDHPLNYFTKNGITIDFGWIHAGPTGQVNLSDKNYILKNIHEKKFAKTIMMAERYAGPMINLLNETKMPHVMVGEDPRYFPCRGRDLFNRPKLYLNAYNSEEDAQHVKEHFSTEIIRVKEKLINAQYDRWFLSFEEKPQVSNTERDIMLDVYTNGNGAAGGKKLKIMKEYLAPFPNAVTYGKWSDDLLAEAPNLNFDVVPMIDLTEEMYRTRYTLMFHFKEGYPSSKFWKMIYFGIIPFFHPNIDSQKNQPVHEYCRVKSAAEFKKKVEELESNPQLRLEIQEYHYSLFKDEYFNGGLLDKIFCHLINKYTNKRIEESKINDFKKISVLFNDEVTNKPTKQEENVDVFDLFANL